jgi:hypothetical protein
MGRGKKGAVLQVCVSPRIMDITKNTAERRGSLSVSEYVRSVLLADIEKGGLLED